MSSPRMKWLLGILLATVLLGYWLRGSSDPVDVNEPGGRSGSGDVEDAPAQPRRPTQSAEPASTTNVVEDIETDILDRVPTGYRIGRDPWRFVEPPPPPPPPPYRPPVLSADEIRRQREAEEAARRAAEEAARLAAEEAARPRPAEFPYVCIGRISTKGKDIFILQTEDGRQVLNVEQGETIGGKFIVARAGLESLEIKFVGFPDWPPKIVPVPVRR